MVSSHFANGTATVKCFSKAALHDMLLIVKDICPGRRCSWSLPDRQQDAKHPTSLVLVRLGNVVRRTGPYDLHYCSGYYGGSTESSRIISWLAIVSAKGI